MMKLIFYFLTVFAIFIACKAEASIEIYVAGHKYESLQDYKSLKRESVSAPVSNQVVPDGQQKDFILSKAKELGMDVDLTKVKTVDTTNVLSDSVKHKLYVLGVEKGITRALKGLDHHWQDLKPLSLSMDNVEEAIRRAVTSNPQPKLLILESGKMRIMTLKTANSGDSKDQLQIP